jgi:hypothetical protein
MLNQLERLQEGGVYIRLTVVVVVVFYWLA